MRQIVIYVEGGGDNSQCRSEIRNGLDALLRKQKQAAQRKNIGWKLVPCGSRNEARKAFFNRRRQSPPETLVVLVVDSEDGLPAELLHPKKESLQARRQRLLADAQTRKGHLVNRDQWELTDIPPDSIHLMVRCMRHGLSRTPRPLRVITDMTFTKSLPVRTNLEDEPKESLYNKLAKATKDTSKGTYAKIRHASKLLGSIDPNKVAVRCPRFATFTSWLEERIGSA